LPNLVARAQLDDRDTNFTNMIAGWDDLAMPAVLVQSGDSDSVRTGCSMVLFKDCGSHRQQAVFRNMIGDAEFTMCVFVNNSDGVVAHGEHAGDDALLWCYFALSWPASSVYEGGWTTLVSCLFAAPSR
jgi:hypothetical protein